MIYKYQILYDNNGQYKESWDILYLLKELELNTINNNLASKDSIIIDMTVDYIASIAKNYHASLNSKFKYLICKDDILPLKLIKFN